MLLKRLNVPLKKPLNVPLRRLNVPLRGRNLRSSKRSDFLDHVSRNISPRSLFPPPRHCKVAIERGEASF